MAIQPRSRPDLVDIPDHVWASDQLAPFLARLSDQHGPIFAFVPVSGPHRGQRVVYLVGPDANRFVFLKGREHFSHDMGWTPVVGETLGHGLLNMDPPEHTRHRALMNPAFTTGFMAAYLPLMQRIIAERTASWLERSEIDLMIEAREITFDVAAAALVGFRTGAEVDWLRERFYILLRGGPPREEEWERFLERLLQVRDELQGKLLELIADRRASLGGNHNQDVLGMLVNARDEEGNSLSDEQLLAHVNILLVAGHETTTTLGAWLLYLLARNPDYAGRLDVELSAVLGPDRPLTSESMHRLPLLSAAVREAGRLQSPVLLLPRGVVSDFEFAGRFVEAGTQVFVAIAAGHRLRSVFEDPDRFDPDRFLPPREEDRRSPYALATFGGGPRICLGINFARVEVMALTAHQRRHFELRPVSDQPIPQFGGILPTVPDGIRVRVTARSS